MNKEMGTDQSCQAAMSLDHSIWGWGVEHHAGDFCIHFKSRSGQVIPQLPPWR
jgi:hypothetical protein